MSDNEFFEDIEAHELPGILRQLSCSHYLTATESNACDFAADELERLSKEHKVKFWRKIAERIRRGPERTKEDRSGRWKTINGRNDDKPYIIRHYLFECRFFDIYIHEIKRSDDDEAYHDHPWPFFHVILEGEYLEETPRNQRCKVPAFVKETNRRKPGYFAFRRAKYAHRLVLDKGDAWTLVISGKRSREWGFIDAVTGCWKEWKAYTRGERC